MAGVVVGVLVIVAFPGLVAPDSEVVAWEQELTSIVAANNDLMALEFLPAVLGARDFEHVQDRSNQPDLPRVGSVCERMRQPTSRLLPLADRAPPRHARTGELVRELAALWRRTLVRCEQLTRAGDVEQFRTGLRPLFDELGVLTAKIGSRLPSDVRCSGGLDPRPKTCDASEPSG